jgi:hypothetical protein
VEGKTIPDLGENSICKLILRVSLIQRVPLDVPLDQGFVTLDVFNNSWVRISLHFHYAGSY